MRAKRLLTNFVLDPDLKRKVKAKAALAGQTLTQVITELLTNYIK